MTTDSNHNDSYEYIAKFINPILKPCPFCGSSASLYVTVDNKHYAYVRCDGSFLPADGGKSCYAQIAPYGARYKTIAKAVDAWNRRVDTHE